MEFQSTVEAIGAAVDAVGVLVIVVGALLATLAFGHRLRLGAELHAAYRTYRQGLGRAIQFLVAGDIIRTVAISPTLGSVGVLAAIVLVRTFLSFSLEVELEGRWPWQRRRTTEAAQPGAPE